MSSPPGAWGRVANEGAQSLADSAGSNRMFGDKCSYTPDTSAVGAPRTAWCTNNQLLKRHTDIEVGTVCNQHRQIFDSAGRR